MVIDVTRKYYTGTKSKDSLGWTRLSPGKLFVAETDYWKWERERRRHGWYLERWNRWLKREFRKERVPFVTCRIKSFCIRETFAQFGSERCRSIEKAYWTKHCSER